MSSYGSPSSWFSPRRKKKKLPDDNAKFFLNDSDDSDDASDGHLEEAATYEAHFVDLDKKYYGGAEVLWRRVVATPRPRRGHSVETNRGAAAAATRIVRGDG